MHTTETIALAGLVMVLGLSACGGGGSSPASNDDMTHAQAVEVGNSLNSLVSGAANSVAHFEIDDGTLTDPDLAPGSTPSRQQRLVDGLIRAGLRASGSRAPQFAPGGILNSANCHPVVTSATDTVDVDHDGIPTDETFSFTSGNCNYTNGDGVTVLVNGSIEIKDLGSIWGFQVNFNSLVFSLSNQTTTGVITIAGSYSASVGANLATVQEALHLVISANNGNTVNATESWVLNFVPATAIASNATHLPAGDATMTGSFTYGHNGETWSVILSTPDPLHYDGECAESPPFASGALEGQIASKRTHGFHITFTGCGTGTVTTSLSEAN